MGTTLAVGDERPKGEPEPKGGSGQREDTTVSGEAGTSTSAPPNRGASGTNIQGTKLGFRIESIKAPKKAPWPVLIHLGNIKFGVVEKTRHRHMAV